MKKLQLFQKEEPSVLVINRPDEKRLDECVLLLDTYYKASELIDLVSRFKPIYSAVKIYEKDLKTGEESLSLITEKIRKGKDLRKIDRLCFISLFLCDESNFRLFYETWSDSLKKVWERIFEIHYIESRELKELYGSSGIHIGGYWGHDISLDAALSWFKVRVGEYDYMSGRSFHYLYLPRELREFFYLLIFPEKKERKETLAELPEDAALSVFKGEKAITREFPLIQSVYKQGGIAVNGSKKIPVAVLKKLSKQIGMEEFFSESSISAMANLRAGWTLFLLVYFMEWNEQEDRELPEMHELVYDLVKNIYYVDSVLVMQLLPHIKGMKRSLLKYRCLEALKDNIVIFCQEIASLGKLDEWYSLDSLINHINFQDGGYDMLFFKPEEKVQIYCDVDGTEVRYDKYISYLGIPFIKMFVLMLSGVGLFDVAYRKGKDTDIAWIEGIKYFRLTNLGKYVLGFVETYTPDKDAEEKDYFELDPDRLIIKSLIPGSPYEKLLSDVAEPIGLGRYKVSYASFLKNCKDVSDLSRKIDFFRQFISDKWSTVWTQFFVTLGMRGAPFVEVDTEDYLIYKLDRHNIELVNLMVTDSVLRECTIKAEGYLFLVGKRNKRKFQSRMKELGYMM